ncbi:hypothetical protein D1007_60367 [Hordeum vulgare]|nr:hypothetical protein D1007_60367 [Hordeum vulgare]
MPLSLSMRRYGQSESKAPRSTSPPLRDNVCWAGNSPPAACARRTKGIRSSAIDVARWKHGMSTSVGYRYRPNGKVKTSFSGPSRATARKQRCDDAGADGRLVLVGDADLEEEDRWRGEGDATECRLERRECDVPEGEIAEAGPQAAPPAGEEARARSGGGAAEPGEDQEEKVVGEGAEGVHSVGWAWLEGTSAAPRTQIH